MKEGLPNGGESFIAKRHAQAMQQSDAREMALPAEELLYQEVEFFSPGEPLPFQQQEQEQQLAIQIPQRGMKPNQVRHSENLHGNGKPGVNGLTGYYHGQYYDQGIPMKAQKGGDKNGK